MNDGLFTKLHQNYLLGTNENYKDFQTYLAKLKLLQYDTLYGQNYIHNENSIPVASHLKLGTK